MVAIHPVLGKRKSFDICQAFTAGTPPTAEGHVFYGVNETNLATWRKVLSSGRPYFYIDNSYFDETRGTHFRVTKNAIQCRAAGESTGERLRAIFGGEPELKPWKTTKEGHIIVCPQSDIFMEMVAGYNGNWLRDTLQDCGRVWPNNAVILRAWSPNKILMSKTLKEDLASAILLITHSSMAAVAAIMEGVGIAVSRMHALRELGPSNDRLPALRVLADNQWTLDEIRAGKAWRWLNQ